MARRTPLFTFFYVLVITLFSGIFAVTQASENRVTIGTGGVTGLYFPTGGAICRLLKKNTDFQCKVLSTGGSFDNLKKLQETAIDLGIVQSDVQYDAVNGVGKFSGKPDPNLRALFALYTETFTLVTRQDTGIRTLGQLQKRKVDIGNPGSGERNTMELLMQAQGWTQETFAKVKVPDSNKEEVSQLPAAKRAAALCKKEIDAYVYMVGHPSNAMREVARNCSVVFIPIPDDVVSNFVKKYPFYTPTEIPSGLYRGIDTLVPSIGVSATVVSSQTLPEETAYQITKNVFNQLETLKRLNPAYQQLTPQSMSQNALSAPLHPGALRYYHESGLIPEKK